MSNRITLDDYIQSEFYQLPKIFFDIESKYFSMSMNAKVLYSLLKNRLELSKKNNWVNENGEVYLIMTRVEAAEMLGIGETMARKTFHELEEMKLVEDVRQGLTKPNLIYINKCDIECCSRPSKSDGQERQNLTASNNDIKENENKKENIKENPSVNEKHTSDFIKSITYREAIEKIYSAYPCKKGKAKGVEYVLAYLKNGRKITGFGNVKFNHEELYCAVRRYSIECERNETDPDYMKHFSTFMNKDVIDYVDLAKEAGFDKYMTKEYGPEWRKIRFIYTE